MAKRYSKITPIAASVALSLGLSGCLGDDDNNVKVDTPPQPIQKEVTQTSNFNVTVSGKVVKGALYGALVSVKTVNESGELVDVAYRTQSGEVTVKGSATTEEEAQKKATEAMLADNPSDLKTNEKGFYSIFVDENFNGPLHITVKATKDSDAVVKCDAFVGCGAGSDVNGNGDGKIEFGEWYKDDVELSVIKLISKPTTESAKSSKQFADGDNGIYTANVTVFTSAATSILLKSASEKEIDSSAISDASVKVIDSLVGDTTLVASLIGDISLGGAIDFTDVESSDTLDAGSLTLIQVAASIQAVATKGDKSIDEVLTELNTSIDEGTLDENATFEACKEEAKTAGEILIAAITGDDEALKKALEDAGIPQDEIEETANSISEAKDKAIENSGTDEDDIKEDIDDVKEQLDNLGDDADTKKNKALETENTTVLSDLSDSESVLDLVSSTLDGLNEDLTAVQALAVEDNNFETKEAAIAYFTLANNLNELYKLQVNTGSDSSQTTTELIALEKDKVSALKTRAETLVTEDTKYQSTLDIADSLSQRITSLTDRQTVIGTEVTANFELATQAVEAFGSILEGLKSAAEASIVEIDSAKQVYDDGFSPLSTSFELVKTQVANISDLNSANDALTALDDVISDASSTLLLAQTFEQKSEAAKPTVDAYKAEADAQATDVDIAEELQKQVSDKLAAAQQSVKDVQNISDELQTLQTEAQDKKSNFETDIENDKLNDDIVANIDKITVRASSEQSEITQFETELDTAKVLGTDADTEMKVSEYFEAMLVLSSSYNDVKRDIVRAALREYVTQAEPLLVSAQALSDKNSKYQPTRRSAKNLIDRLNISVDRARTLYDDIRDELQKAKDKADEYDILVETAKRAAENAVDLASSASATFDSSKIAFDQDYTAADSAYNDRNDYSSIKEAISLIDTALASYNPYRLNTGEFYDKSASALVLVQSYIDLLGSTDSSSQSLLNSAQALVTKSELAKDELNNDNRTSILEQNKSTLELELTDLEGVSDVAREGTAKVVTASFVTKEGSNALYDVGEKIFDVVEDILDEGSFDSEKQNGCSEKYPDWCYEYEVNTNANDFNFLFENVKDGQKIDLDGYLLTSKVKSKIVITWTGTLLSETGSKIEISAPSLAECEEFALGVTPMPNASCAVLEFDREVANVDQAENAHILRVYSSNVVEIVDGQYGFDGTVTYNVYGEDAEGNPAGLFSSGDVIEYADFTVAGITEQTRFNTIFDVKYDDIHQEIGSAKVSLLEFNGYEFKVDLVDEVGPLVGEVSIYNNVEGKQKTFAGTIREITNGFKIVYADDISIDYENIEFIGKSN